MDLPDEAPKLPKLPFLLGDVVLLAVAAYLAYQAGPIPSPTTIIGIIVCAGLGVALAIAPFLIGYARTQDILLRERQDALEALVRTTASAADQAGIAAHGLHEIAEITKRNLHDVDTLPARIEAARTAAQTKESHQHAAAVEALRNDIDQLRDEQIANSEATGQLIERLLAELAATEAKLTAALSDLASQVQQRSSSLATESPAPPPTRKSRARPATNPTDSTSETQDEANESAPEAAPEAKPAPKPRPRRRSTDDDSPSLFALPDEAAEPPPPTAPADLPDPADFVESAFGDDEDETFTESLDQATLEEPGSDETEFTDEFETAEIIELESTVESVPAPPPPPAKRTRATKSAEAASPPATNFDDAPANAETASADGLTRLTVTAYIGIGNRLFVRGHGPGLSPNEGTPLQFVSIGKWRWETDAASAPIRLTLWKNDQVPCTALGEVIVNPGAHLETNANF